MVLAQIDDLEKQMQKKEDELFDMKRAYDRRSEEVETLTRALSIKAKGLSSACGSDVHSRLLYAISQARDSALTNDTYGGTLRVNKNA